MKTYRVCVETHDGCRTIWYEKSKARKACDNITNRVYNRLCGLNIKRISVEETPTPLPLADLKRISLPTPSV